MIQGALLIVKNKIIDFLKKINLTIYVLIIHIVILIVFTFFIIKPNENFLDFLSSDKGLFFNIILTYILIYNFQTPYFQSPKDIFINSLSIFILMLPTKNILLNSWLYFFVLLIPFIFCCYIFYAIYYYQSYKIKYENKFFNFIVKISVNYKILYFGAIFVSLFAYNEIHNKLYILLCFIFFSSNIVSKILKDLFSKKKEIKNNFKNYGQLFRIDEPNIYRILLSEEVKNNNLLFLKNNNSILKLYILSKKHTTNGMICSCIKIDNTPDEKIKEYSRLNENIVFNIDYLPDSENIYKDIVGFVVENSNIDLIKFELKNNETFLKEGDVVYFINLNKEKVYYQIINGNTIEESIDSNFYGKQTAEAMQLGIIDEEKGEIKKYPWLPNMNDFIYATSQDEVKNIKKDDSSFYIGNSSGLNLPIKIDIEKLIEFHSAILGVTGTGKSTLAFQIIEEVAKNNKVICIDITGEYKLRFNNYISIKEINNINNNGIYIYEIEEILNEKIIDKVKEFISNLFENQKKEIKNKILLVLEEAHTIVPEDFFISRNNFDLKASVQAVSQIALQGRKYGVGLLVISQRTALVSKTILSQCNTFFTFSLMDQTSLDFLKNFYGEKQIRVIPNLEKYHLIADGVAIGSERPVIINTYNENIKEKMNLKDIDIDNKNDSIPF